MRYVVYTTKHHDGFCMYDTTTTAYKITAPECPFHIHPLADTVRAVFNAFREAGIAIGVYFSKSDWHSPHYWDPTRHASDRNPNYDTAAEPQRWQGFVDFRPDDNDKSTHQLIRLLVDIVCKGGNLLLNVGPQPDSQLPAEALIRMQEIGEWLRVNGEAIYSTRPIAPYAEGRISFTRRGKRIYAIYARESDSASMPDQITLSTLTPAVGSSVHMLGVQGPLTWHRDSTGTTIVAIPRAIRNRPPCRHAFAITFQI